MNRGRVAKMATAGVLATVLLAANAGQALAHLCYNANKPPEAGRHASIVVVLDEEGNEVGFEAVSTHPGAGQGPDRPTGGFLEVVVEDESGSTLLEVESTFQHNYLVQASQSGSPTNGIQHSDVPPEFLEE